MQSRYRMIALGMVVLAGCAPQRRIDPASIDLPAAERLSPGQVMEIADAVSRYHARGYGLLAERSGIPEVSEMAGEALAAEQSLRRRLASVGVARQPHHLARAVLEREAGLGDDLPEAANAQQTAAFLRRLAEQDRWFLILIDNSLAKSVSSGAAGAYVREARAHTLESLTRLRARRAALQERSS